jgi:hypothetical protein
MRTPAAKPSVAGVKPSASERGITPYTNTELSMMERPRKSQPTMNRNESVLRREIARMMIENNNPEVAKKMA